MNNFENVTISFLWQNVLLYIFLVNFKFSGQVVVLFQIFMGHKSELFQLTSLKIVLFGVHKEEEKTPKVGCLKTVSHECLLGIVAELKLMFPF